MPASPSLWVRPCPRRPPRRRRSPSPHRPRSPRRPRPRGPRGPRTSSRASRYHPADAPASSVVPSRAPVGGAGPMTRLLGIDLGSKRIGLATADAGIGIARSLATVNRGATPDNDAATLARVCREQDVSELVVGLPIEAHGAEGAMAE